MKNLKKMLIIAGGVAAGLAAIGGVIYFLYKKGLWPFGSEDKSYYAYDLADEDFGFEDDDDCGCEECDCDCCDSEAEEDAE